MEVTARILEAVLLPAAIFFSLAGAFADYADWRRGMGNRLRILAYLLLFVVYVLLLIAYLSAGMARIALLWTSACCLFGWLIVAVMAASRKLKDYMQSHE